MNYSKYILLFSLELTLIEEKRGHINQSKIFQAFTLTTQIDAESKLYCQLIKINFNGIL